MNRRQQFERGVQNYQRKLKTNMEQQINKLFDN